MPFNPEGNREEIEDFVENSIKNFKQKTDIVFVTLDKNEEFIGCCGIHNINSESVELGLWIKEDGQGKGYGTEIINGLILYIENNLKVRYIIYPVDRENMKSRKIPEKLGFSAFQNYTQKKNDSIQLDIIEYRKYYPN